MLVLTHSQLPCSTCRTASFQFSHKLLISYLCGELFPAFTSKIIWNLTLFPSFSGFFYILVRNIPTKILLYMRIRCSEFDTVCRKYGDVWELHAIVRNQSVKINPYVRTLQNPKKLHPIYSFWIFLYNEKAAAKLPQPVFTVYFCNDFWTCRFSAGSSRHFKQVFWLRRHRSGSLPGFSSSGIQPKLFPYSGGDRAGLTPASLLALPRQHLPKKRTWNVLCT